MHGTRTKQDPVSPSYGGQLYPRLRLGPGPLRHL